MGAAGISCSTTEMSEKGNSGMVIDLNKVPLREKTMTAYEIMLSESQERMLVVAKKGKEDRVKEIFEKWDLNCETIGFVTNKETLKAAYHNELKADVPPFDLVLGGGVPVYYRETKKPKYLEETQNFNFNSLPKPKDLGEIFEKIFSSPNIASKKWVYEQYDSMVRTNTVIGPGGDSAVVRIKGTKKAIAMNTDCNGRYVYLNPKEGTKIAVAESARNIVCSGGKPLAVTNCLNFGNPYDPEIYWTFKEAIEGMGEACRFFDTPVTGGNVSFYNESPDTTVYQTPVIGMIGLIENTENIMTSYFKNVNDKIYLIGEDFEEIGGSEYLSLIHNSVKGNSPILNLETEQTLHNILLELIAKKIINSAHDISEGGIICAIAESCIINDDKNIGANVNIPVKTREDFSFFSESQSRVIVSVSEENENEFLETLKSFNFPYNLLGKTGGENFIVNNKYSITLDKLNKLYYESIPDLMNE
jgi:phosphoribosylformylglycinamidine synthase